jgi:hypothetical protein
MADTYIKPEVKPDPDALGASPSALDEDDIYEDAGDLEFNTDPKYQSLYLARVPKYVWEAWSKLDDDAEIQIGTVRMTNSIDEKTKTEKARHYLVDKSILLIVWAGTSLYASLFGYCAASNGSKRI